MDIQVRPQSPSGPTSTPVGPYETIAERLVLGYQAGGGPTRPRLLSTSPLDGSANWCHSVGECADLQADYLMITAHRFFQDGDSSSPAFELAEHRASLNGFNVAIVDVDVVAPPTEESRDALIKAFIVNDNLTSLLATIRLP
jgi:hypothetical protein